MSLLGNAPFCVIECETFLDLLSVDKSKESQIAASLYFRKKLAACQQPPGQFIDRIVEALIDCLQRPFSDIQLNASWALTNLACGSRQETHRILAHGGAPALMQLASNTSGELRNQAIWALGNLAADCALCRAIVRSVGLVHLLSDLLELPDYRVYESRAIVIWCLANLLRGGISDLELECVEGLVRCLHSTIMKYDNPEIVCDAIWSIAYLIENVEVQGARIDVVLAEPGLVVKVLALLKSESTRVLSGALRTVGNIVTGTDEQTNAVLNLGVLSDLRVLVDSTHNQISREALWVLSNVAAGTAEQVTQLFSAEGITERVFVHCQSVIPRKRKEAYWVLINAVMGASDQLFDHLFSGGLAQIVVKVLDEKMDPDSKLVERTTTAILHSLEQRPKREYTVALFRRVGLVDRLTKIAQDGEHPNMQLAQHILRQHFGVNPAEQATAPSAADGNEDDGAQGSQQRKKTGNPQFITVHLRREG